MSASQHDAIFEDFDEESLSREDLALFPDYLVCVDGDESGAVMELLSSDLPVKVLVETEELLDPGTSASACAARSSRAPSVGLIDVFAFQTTSSNLYQLRDRLLAGLQYAGPTLVSIFSGLDDAVERPAALPAVGGGARGARLPRVHVRPCGRAGLGVAVLGRRESAARARLAARAARVR